MGRRGRKKLTDKQRQKKAERNARRGREPEAKKNKTVPGTKEGPAKTLPEEVRGQGKAKRDIWLWKY